MATVYLARDVRHARQVAIKVLHPELAAVLGAERFLAEITTTANLQHPHILPLFDSGTADGQLFYVMPFVEGETLRARLDRETQLPIADAVQLAREVADALQYAHDRGVIHRDIKPENIPLHGAHALVADFGIALAVQHAGGQRMTQTGLSLGTPQYMAPEQAMGEKSIDARADLYSLGAVTYEMLAGEPPFTGPTAQAIVAKVMTASPAPLTTLRPKVPAHLDAAVQHALEKLPPDRVATARAFAEALTSSTESPADVRRTAAIADARHGSTPTRAHRVWQVVATVSAGIALWAFARGGGSSAAATSNLATVSDLAPAAGETWLNISDRQNFALAPDGRHIAVGGAVGDFRGILIRSLDSVVSRRLAGTTDGFEPFFSPTGDSLGFFADGKPKVLDLASDAARELCPAPLPTGGAWGADGVIPYIPARGGPVHRTTVGGGNCEAVRLRNAPAGPQLRPFFLGDGRHIVLAGTNRTWLVAPGEDSASLLVTTSGLQQPVVGLPDWLLFTPPGAPSRAVHAQRIGIRARALVGPSALLFSEVSNGGSRTALSTAPNGTLISYLSAGATAYAARVVNGLVTDSTARPLRTFNRPRASQDGSRMILGGFRLSLWDPRRELWSDLLPLQSPAALSDYPVWWRIPARPSAPLNAW